jgi:hypothetical protein
MQFEDPSAMTASNWVYDFNLKPDSDYLEFQPESHLGTYSFQLVQLDLFAYYHVAGEGGGSLFIAPKCA